MLFFLLRKSYIFWFFLFSKKFIISNEKSRKTNNLNSENKLLLTKNQKNKHYLIHIDIYLGRLILMSSVFNTILFFIPYHLIMLEYESGINFIMLQ